MQNNNNETKINFMNLLPSLKTGKVTLDFGSVEISIDINVNRKDNIVNQVANKIVEEVQDKTDNEPVVNKLMSEELDKDNFKDKLKSITPASVRERETGWFKGTYNYGGEIKTSLHYYEDGIAICDNGNVSRNHMLSSSHTRVDVYEDDPETYNCCPKCIAKLSKPESNDKPKNATGWFLRKSNSRKGTYKHFYSNGRSICRNNWQLTCVDKESSLETDTDVKLCKACQKAFEKAKANTKADLRNKTVIKTLSSRDIIRPNEMLERWNSKLVKIDNPVPLNDTEGDDIYVEATKRLLVVFRKSINNTMRKLSADNKMTIDNTNIKFYCKNKIVEVNVYRNPNQKNSELNIRKINVVNRTSPNQKITGNAYDMTSMVTKVILERSRMLNEKED